MIKAILLAAGKPPYGSSPFLIGQPDPGSTLPTVPAPHLILQPVRDLEHSSAIQKSELGGTFPTFLIAEAPSPLGPLDTK